MPGLLTTAEREDFQAQEEALVNELRSRAQQQLSGVNSPSDVHVRDILPSEDLDVDDADNDNGWNGEDREWAQDGMSADSLNQVYEIDSANKMEGKVIGIFAISSVASSVITTEVLFEDGTGSRFERLMFQEAQTLADGEYALMRNPVIFNEGKDGKIYIWADTASDEQLIFHGAVAEKAGTTLGTRSQGESAPTGTSRRPNRR